MKRIFCIALAAALTLMVCGGAAAKAGSDVAYEIFVGSFADSDGDGVGDLAGITQHLDYIEALGVDMIWLTPIYPSPSYHHYDVTDYMDVAPEFGTLDDFDALIDECDARGIGVIIDIVFNHSSAEHSWFTDACAALASGMECATLDWYNFTYGEGQHAVPGADGWFYEGAFGAHMPDFNLDSAELRTELSGILAFWLEHGAAGFRLDAMTSYYSGAPQRSADFTAYLVESAKAIKPDCYIVGECWADGAAILDLYRSGIDSLFNFPVSDADGLIVKATLGAQGAAYARLMAAWNADIKAAAPQAQDAPFISNHDQARARGMLRSNPDAMKVAAAVYLMLPGRPFIYYGEEIGMSGSGRDENKRLPMLWSADDDAANCCPPENADQAQRLKEGVDVQAEDGNSLLNWYRTLIALRSRIPQLAHGSMTALDTDNPALCAYTVEQDGEAALVLINTSQTDAVSIVDILNDRQSAALLGCVGADEAAVRGGELPPVACAVFDLTGAVSAQ